ncbi:MAG: D-alanine--D-alanine ligase [Spirochaetales bacterium]|jgi:D-alanine-D-alanine ligase|nr:D-alanine--D-alanine ligase [Spirochaetales bacterium]
MKTVLILYGGRSGEHEVSLQSAASVVYNLSAQWKILLAGIDKEGVWYLQPQSAVEAARASAQKPLAITQDENAALSIVPGRGAALAGRLLPIDVVFPVLHGSFGEDGLVQGLLENARLAYVGAGVLGSALSMDKDTAKRVWRDAGIPVTPFFTLRTEEPREQAGKTAEAQFGYPFFVKPSAAGSSVGISKVHAREEFFPAIDEAFRYDSKVLVEKALSAREIECSVLGNLEPRAFTPGEIIPSHEFYDYNAKYIDSDGARLLVPAALDDAAREKVKALAVRAYRAAEAEGMARVDFFLDKDSGGLYVNEINTLPGFTGISMFPRMCAHGGLSYAALLDELLELGMERQRRREGLTFSYG